MRAYIPAWLYDLAIIAVLEVSRVLWMAARGVLSFSECCQGSGWPFSCRGLFTCLILELTHDSRSSYGCSAPVLRVLAERARWLQRLPTAWGSHASRNDLHTRGRMHALQHRWHVMWLSDILQDPVSRGAAPTRLSRNKQHCRTSYIPPLLSVKMRADLLHYFDR